MHNGMSLSELLNEVVRHQDAKADYIADTREHMAMVPMEGFSNGVALVLNRPQSSELERFEITDTFHEQVASRLKIPKAYYTRLLTDHRDLLLHNVNELFNREPNLRMVRTLDGRARAFLSRQYRRIDNDAILEQTLPVIKNDFPTKVLSTNVNENRLRFKCLFTGDEHTADIGRVKRDGSPDTVQAGFEMGNSEVGRGSFYIRSFFYRSYCLNGCVFGTETIADLKVVHVGSRLGVDESMLLSPETLDRERDLILSSARDVLQTISHPDFVQRMAARLRSLTQTKNVRDPHAAVEEVAKQLRLTDETKRGVLESFIRDQDYTQWGMVNAITEQGNSQDDYERASRMEELGAKIINLPANRWNRIADLETVAA